MKKYILILSLSLISTGMLHSAENAAAFLETGGSIRSKGLGGTQVSHTFNSHSVLANPAGLGRLNALDIHATNTKFIGEVDVFDVGVAMPFGKRFGIGISYLSVGVNGIPEYLTNGSSTGQNFKYKGKSLAFGLGTHFKKIYFGSTLKVINETLHTRSAKGYSLDVGALAQVQSKIWVGAHIKNLTKPSVKWNTDSDAKDTLARTETLSLTAYPKDKWMMTTELIHQSGRMWEYQFGTEYKLYQNGPLDLDVRAGKNNYLTSLGIGAKFHNFTVDYAYEYFDEAHLTRSSWFGVGYRRELSLRKKSKALDFIQEDQPIITEVIEEDISVFTPYVEEELPLFLSPNEIPSLTLWLDASDVSTVSTNNQGQLLSWKDKSDAKGHLYQDILDQQPVLNQSSVKFDGNDTMSFSDNLLSLSQDATALTVFVVLKPETLNQPQQYFMLSSADTLNARFSMMLNDSAGAHLSGEGKLSVAARRLDSDPYQRINGGDITNPERIIHAASVDYEKGFIIQFLNGEKVAADINFQTPGRSDGMPSERGTLGGRKKQFFTGDIYEVLVYKRALTFAEKREVNDYLIHKWMPKASEDESSDLVSN